MNVKLKKKNGITRSSYQTIPTRRRRDGVTRCAKVYNTRFGY